MDTIKIELDLYYEGEYHKTSRQVIDVCTLVEFLRDRKEISIPINMDEDKVDFRNVEIISVS